MQFWRLFYILRESGKETDLGGGGGGANGDDADDEEGDDDDGTVDAEGNKPKPKFVPLEKHKRVKSRLTTKLTTALTENATLKARNAELESKVSESDVKTKKSDAITTAKAALKEKGLQFKSDNEKLLQETVEGLVYDEKTFGDRVANLVQGFAEPIKSGKPVVGNRNRDDDTGDKDPLDYSGKELGQIQKDDPDGYAAIMAARKEAIQKKRAKKS